jgi:hypothetical protein
MKEALFSVRFNVTLFPFHRTVDFIYFDHAPPYRISDGVYPQGHYHTKHVHDGKYWLALQEIWTITKKNLIAVIDAYSEEYQIPVMVSKIPHKAIWHIIPCIDADLSRIEFPLYIKWRDCGRVHDEGLAKNRRMTNQFSKDEWSERARIYRLWMKKLEVHKWQPRKLCNLTDVF